MFQGKLKCCVLPKDAYCKEKVEKILSACQHTDMFDCSQPTTDHICQERCNKLLCLEGHRCPKRCYEPCGPCNVLVERTLGCGHKNTMQCHVDPATVKCKLPKKALLPFCNHQAEIACGDTPEVVRCPFPCDIRLDCGHGCTLKCHVRNDPGHEKYLCRKACEKRNVSCKRSHKCGKQCHEECRLCPVRWKRDLPCGHSNVAECHLNDEQIVCKYEQSSFFISRHWWLIYA